MPGKKLKKPVKKKEEKKVKKPATGKSTVQAVVFGKGWKPADARDWLKKNNLNFKGKVHKTKNGTLKYTILDEKDFEKLSFKRTNKGVSFVLGINPKSPPVSPPE